jgi:hypothetical protein
VTGVTIGVENSEFTYRYETEADAEPAEALDVA